MRIVFCVSGNYKSIGGIDTAVSFLAKELISCGHFVHIVTKDKAALNLDADIFYFHGLWIPWYINLAKFAKRKGIPYIISPHGMIFEGMCKFKWFKKIPFHYFFQKKFLCNASALISASDIESRNIKKLLPFVKVKTIHYGLTSTNYNDYFSAKLSLSLLDHKVNIVFLSRLVEGKGLSKLIDALINIKYLSKMRLFIIGSGNSNYEQKIKDKIDKNSFLLPEIIWLGDLWGDDKWSYLKAADLLCLPSKSENFGFAISEALQVGTPILTSFNTPWSEFMRDIRGGIFTDFDTQSIRNALELFLSNPDWSPEARKKLSQWTHQKFNWGDTINEFNKLIMQIKKDHFDQNY